MLFDFSKEYTPEEFANFILYENHTLPTILEDCVEEDYIAELIRIDRKKNYDRGYCTAIARSKKTNILAESLQLIIDIGFDHDGYKSAENLGDLIDELVNIARIGLEEANKHE